MTAPPAAGTPLTTADQATSFDSVNPATGELIGSFPIHTAAEVAETVERARTAANWWADLGERARRQRLTAWRRLLVERTDELVALIGQENGKTKADAVIEVTVATTHLAWATN